MKPFVRFVILGFAVSWYFHPLCVRRFIGQLKLYAHVHIRFNNAKLYYYRYAGPSIQCLRMELHWL